MCTLGLCKKIILKVVVLKHIITAGISVNSNYALIGSDGTVQHWYSGTVPKAVNTSLVFFFVWLFSFFFFCNTERRKVLPKEATWVEAVRCYHSTFWLLVWLYGVPQIDHKKVFSIGFSVF